MPQKIHVRATVSYPIYIDQEMEVPDNASPEQIREAILKYADLYLAQGSSTPIIVDSQTHPELNE